MIGVRENFIGLLDMNVDLEVVLGDDSHG